MNVPVIGFAWYDSAAFILAQAHYADRHTLNCSYTDWLKNADSTFKRRVNEGAVIVKVKIEFEHFHHWCDAKGLELGTAAQAVYAGAIANHSLDDDEV